MTEPAVTTTWHPPAPPVWALWALRLAAAAGLALSLWLFWPVASGSAMPGCGTDPGFTCGSVLVSRWARWFGIPVSILAALLYATALVALVYVAPGRSSRHQASSSCHHAQPSPCPPSLGSLERSPTKILAHPKFP